MEWWLHRCLVNGFFSCLLLFLRDCLGTPEWRFTWFPKSSHILPVLLRFFVGTLWETYGNGFPSFEFESLEFPPLLCKYVHSARPFQVPNLVPKPFPKHLPSMYQPGPCLGWAPSSIPSWLKSLEASGSLAAAVHWQKVSHFRLGNGSSTSHVKGLFDLSRSHHVCEDVQWGKAGWTPGPEHVSSHVPIHNYRCSTCRLPFFVQALSLPWNCHLMVTITNPTISIHIP